MAHFETELRFRPSEIEGAVKEHLQSILGEVAPPGAEYEKLVRKLKKQYTGSDEEHIPFAIAWAKYNRDHGKKSKKESLGEALRFSDLSNRLQHVLSRSKITGRDIHQILHNEEIPLINIILKKGVELSEAALKALRKYKHVGSTGRLSDGKFYITVDERGLKETDVNTTADVGTYSEPIKFTATTKDMQTMHHVAEMF